MNESAAEGLEGLVLKDKWTVVKKIEPKPGATGGFFSVCYIVEDKNKKQAFLKALNFLAFFQIFKGRPIIEILAEQTNAFEYEKSLLKKCRDSRLSKVSIVIDDGQEEVDGYTIPQVPYLIFEIADGDIRSRINFNNDLELAWKLNSLHNVAVGLEQLHSIQIGHQDLKPSNVLLFDKGIISKIGDLGRSLSKDTIAPHEDGNFPGDYNYAPPEFLYRFLEPDWNKRVMATDLYLFGSLIVFYFTGINMTALIGKNLPDIFRWDKWGGSFEDVEAYLLNAYSAAIEEFSQTIPNPQVSAAITDIVKYCCHPLPKKRGHPKNILEKGNQYSFTRTITQLDLLVRKVEIKFI